MRRWAILLVALLALGAAVPAVDAKPKPTKKQQRCLKAAKKKRTKAKRRAAKQRCLKRKSSKPRAQAPSAPAAAPGVPSGPAPGAPAPSTPDEPGGPTLPDDPAGGGRSVQVQSSEWELRLSRTSVLAGYVRVEFDNSRGEDAHDLKLLRGSTLYSFDEQPSGGITAKTLKLSAGRWQLFLPEHAERGMKAQLSVTNG
jgi:hypothetical protein